MHAFKRAKCILTSEHVLVDASLKNGLGFVLKQLQPDLSWRPIQLGDCTLHDAETRYALIELELQAIVYATSKCNMFLAGHNFVIFTDHLPLTTICNKRRLDEVANTRILQSLVKLLDYNFAVEYLPGLKNSVADTLSRHPTNTSQHEIDNLTQQVFHINTARRVQAEVANCSFRLQQIQDVASEDL